jgi:hypothetical protein
MSNEKSSIENRSAANLFSRLETPNPFTPDWHHQLGSKLCAFPRYLILPLEGDGTPLGLAGNAQFWPDLATFVEGSCWTALMYYPGASRASVCVLHWQDVPRWEVIQFDDERVVAKSVASSYEEAMGLVMTW